ncbi:hypothetical protein B296_00006294 [Ensete ventricosum]|uniref:Uncharacterized protein n=1 Tax=Ensete ventricosum TaxID=4639 RepID=A0A427B6E5_ENSVE|nr:hypothetical protein B296_00006294 [Ensete ventricosum]
MSSVRQEETTMAMAVWRLRKKAFLVDVLAGGHIPAVVQVVLLDDAPGERPTKKLSCLIRVVVDYEPMEITYGYCDVATGSRGWGSAGVAAASSHLVGRRMVDLKSRRGR